MHDVSLDCTTTGTGKLADYTWKELKKLKLNDARGVMGMISVAPTYDKLPNPTDRAKAYQEIIYKAA